MLPSILQRLEGLALMGAALAIYASQGFGWLMFALLLLAPDLAALGYLAGSQTGNTSYNLAHTIAFPLALAVLAGLTGQPLGLQLALIWLAHIGMDRAVGYGFKEGEMPRPTRHKR
jgi:succinate dehydrogenase/fumarate reductase cytochrome b subunit